MQPQSPPKLASLPLVHLVIGTAITVFGAAFATIAAFVSTHGLNLVTLIPMTLGVLHLAVVTVVSRVESNPQFSQDLTSTVLDLPQEIKELPDLVHTLHARVAALFATQHTHATPPTAIGQAAPSVQPPIPQAANVPPGAVLTGQYAQAAPVQQVPFPAPPHWPGDTGVTPAQQQR